MEEEKKGLVLILEDVEIISNALRREFSNYVVDFYTNQKQFLEGFEELGDAADLIILDNSVPYDENDSYRMNRNAGIEILSQLAEIEYQGEVILHTNTPRFLLDKFEAPENYKYFSKGSYVQIRKFFEDK